MSNITEERLANHRPLLEQLFAAQRGLCYLCKTPMRLKIVGPRRPPETATIEHVIPLIRGGSNTPENKRAAHKLCNTIKANMLPDECAAMFVNGYPENENGLRARYKAAGIVKPKNPSRGKGNDRLSEAQNSECSF